MRQLQKYIVLLTATLLSTGAPCFAQYEGQYPANQGAYAPQNQGQGQPMPAPAQMAVGAPQMTPSYGMPVMNTAVAPQPSGPGITIAQWFSRYDQIRREAQMSPQERQRADALMSRGLSILVPGDDKIATKQLLGMMVGRYQKACAQLKALPQIPPTSQLHASYFNYFNTAGNLFADYVRVQDNLFLTDATTGQPVAAGLIQRKQMLEMLEGRCKQMDAATRNQFGIPPYQY